MPNVDGQLRENPIRLFVQAPGQICEAAALQNEGEFGFPDFDFADRADTMRSTMRHSVSNFRVT